MINCSFLNIFFPSLKQYIPFVFVECNEKNVPFTASSRIEQIVRESSIFFVLLRCPMSSKRSIVFYLGRGERDAGKKVSNNRGEAIRGITGRIITKAEEVEKKKKEKRYNSIYIYIYKGRKGNRLVLREKVNKLITTYFAILIDR